MLACGVLCCLGLIATTESNRAMFHSPDNDGSTIAATVADERALREEASRSMPRVTPSPTKAAAKPTPTPTKAPTPAPANTTATPTAKPSPTKPPAPAKPAPVAGLTQDQMDNAAAIVKVGQTMQLSRWGIIIAIATAMQESNLYNVASGVLPESMDYPHQGVGWDHDSVGLFQQRPSSGWGSVANLMKPAYAAEKFYSALVEVPGWANMALTEAAQAVQVSAFPDAYAKHEGRATTVVDALL